MKFLFFYVSLFLSSISLYGQFGPQQIISNNNNFPRSVVTADVDGDKDLDIIVTSQSDNRVVWYENLDGLGNFSKEKLIGDSLSSAVGVYAADIDQDNDIDVIATSGSGDKVVWFRNLDGLGSFSEEISITTLVDGPLSVYAADIDGDNDLDVVSASFNDSDINWYENTNGLGVFGPKQVIHGSAVSVRQIHVVDIDGDDDMDVTAAAAGSDEVIWYENTDGLGTFGSPQVLTNSADGVISVYAADFDGDKDMDIVAAAFADQQVVWFENLDGQGNFGSKQVAAEDLQSVRDVKVADIDNDDDMDILCAFAYPTTNNTSAIAWIENTDGQGTFGTPQIISTELSFARMAYPSDLDGDGDQDVVSTSSSDDKVAWYENFTILGTADIETIGIKIYPNPAKDLLIVESPLEVNEVFIYNMLGAKLRQVSKNTNVISMANLPSGLLLVELVTEKGKIIEKIIKE